MSKNAAEPVILVISGDKDFAGPLAEQIENILQLPCMLAESYEAAAPLKPTLALVVSNGEVVDCPLPVVVAKKPPFVLRELLRDIDAALRKHAGEDIELGHEYQLQIRGKSLISRGSEQQVALTDKEVHLLQSLHEAAGDVVSKEQLLKQIWGMEAALETHTLETHIYRLRAKFRELGDENEIIVAADGGYKLKVE